MDVVADKPLTRKQHRVREGYCPECPDLVELFRLIETPRSVVWKCPRCRSFVEVPKKD